MPTLKLFKGNWDGRNERAVVCNSAKAARELLGAGAATMKNYFSQSDEQVRPAYQAVWDSPGVVFQRRMRMTTEQDPWVAVKRSD
jgi:hypothetical protein